MCSPWSHVTRSATLLPALALFLATSCPAQTPPDSKADTANQSPAIKVTTRLIQLTVVAHDRHGKPVSGLKREEFTVLDKNVPQKIAFFSANIPATGPTHPLPANFFTNRAELKGEDPPATTVVLFDSLNTSFEDQSFARKQLLRFLQNVKPQDHVALFALTSQLLVLHDFTDDAAALSGSADRFQPRLMGLFDASNPDPFHVPGLTNDPMFRIFESRVNNANDAIADLGVARRMGITYRAFIALANYVEQIPGRKSLVWVTGGLPIAIGTGRIGIPDRENFSWTATAPSLRASQDMSTLARALNRVNMAVYPIDVHGLDVTDSQAAFFLREAQRDTFRVMADGTGGKAFYGTNDVAGAIESAFEDGRYTYTLGFYPDHLNWDGRFRRLRVRVNVEGVHLRYRRGYFALPEKSGSEARMKGDLHDAARSPLDATDLGVSVKCTALGRGTTPQAKRPAQVQVMLQPTELLLRDEEQHRRGGLDLLFLQTNAKGEFLAAEKQHFEVNFSEKEYERLPQDGLILRRRLAVDPATTKIRVLVRDSESAALGSVTFPVSKIEKW